MSMDLYSNNRLASMEYEQGVQSAPIVPEYRFQSIALTPAALTSIRMLPGPGSAMSTSSTRRTSGPP